MKEIKNKTVVIVTAFIAVVLIIVLLLTQCGKKGTDKEKEQSGSKEPGKEVIIDEKEDEAGLTVGTPEDADKEQGNNQVEFVGPENTSDGKTMQMAQVIPMLKEILEIRPKKMKLRRMKMTTTKLTRIRQTKIRTPEI